MLRMLMCKFVIGLFIFFLPITIAMGQTLSTSEETAIQSLRTDFDSLKVIKGDAAKRKLNTLIITKIEELLENPKSYLIGLDSIKAVGKIAAPDNSFRILNWNLSFDDFTYTYINFMQLNPQGKFGYKLLQIKDTRPKIEPSIENTQFTKDNWYGALIYKILLDSYKHQNYYTFFAIDHNNMMSKFKFIDVITFTDKGEPLFGKPIFKSAKTIRSRVVFEYSSQVVMGLKYDEKLKLIVFDHLSPERPDLTGDYKFYGPDFSYDGYKFEDGFWMFQSDLKLSNSPPVIRK
jgi:hypothetical protein